jgi:hypothetical protein
MYAFLVSTMRAIWLSHLIIHAVDTLILFGEC